MDNTHREKEVCLKRSNDRWAGVGLHLKTEGITFKTLRI